jgi:hypothetical protein
MSRAIENVPSNVLGEGVEEGKLLEAVSRSGYPLQTVVGAQLLRRKYVLQEEWPFIDSDTDETRTLDINAIRWLVTERVHTESARLLLFLTILVECKQAELPYVAFEAVSPPEHSTFPPIVGLPQSELPVMFDVEPRIGTSVSPQMFFGLTSHGLVKTPPVASSLSAVHRKGKGFELSGDQAFRSIILPVTKALAHYRAQYGYTPPGSGYESGPEDISARIALPVVVFDAPLLLARVPTGGEPALVPAPWVRIVRRHTLPGREPVWRIPKPTMVELVHKDFFDTYLTRFVHPFSRAFRSRIAEHYDAMSNSFIPGLSPQDPFPKDPYKLVQPESPD